MATVQLVGISNIFQHGGRLPS